MHKFPLPDEAQLEKLVLSVYERMPSAEIVRLNRIEERLARKLLLKKPERKVNTLPWWIVLLLAGGFATAAWWAGEIWLDNYYSPSAPVHRDEPVENLHEEEPGKTVIDTPANTEDGDPGVTRDKKSPVIYQRESF